MAVAPALVTVKKKNERAVAGPLPADNVAAAAARRRLLRDQALAACDPIYAAGQKALDAVAEIEGRLAVANAVLEKMQMLLVDEREILGEWGAIVTGELVERCLELATDAREAHYAALKDDEIERFGRSGPPQVTTP